MSQIIPKEWTENGFLIVPMYFVLSENYRLMSSDAKWAYTLIFNAWVIDKKKSIVEKDEVLHVCFTKEELLKLMDVSDDLLKYALMELEEFGLIITEKDDNGNINLLPEISLTWPKNE